MEQFNSFIVQNGDPSLLETDKGRAGRGVRDRSLFGLPGQKDGSGTSGVDAKEAIREIVLERFACCKDNLAETEWKELV